MASINFKIHMLDSEHYLFGGKGDVWNNKIHISKIGGTTTLCGVPMLSTNWSGFHEDAKAGCEKCLLLHGLHVRRN